MPLHSFLKRLIWLCVLPLLLLAAYLAVDRVLTTRSERDLDAANEAATPEEATKVGLLRLCGYGNWVLGRLATTNDANLSCGRNGRNAAAEWVFSCTAAKIAGRSVVMLIPDVAAAIGIPLSTVMGTS